VADVTLEVHTVGWLCCQLTQRNTVMCVLNDLNTPSSALGASALLCSHQPPMSEPRCHQGAFTNHINSHVDD
jgi:hypothetical protein